MENKAVIYARVSSTGERQSTARQVDLKMNTLRKLYNTLKYEWPTVEVDADIAKDAVKPINRMLELS